MGKNKSGGAVLGIGSGSGSGFGSGLDPVPVAPVIEPTLIDGAYYGRSYELGITTCEDGTVCNAVDTGTIFVAYKGVWYEQPGSFWAASLSSSGTLGLSTEIGKITPADDLLLFDAVDTGARYVSFQGSWYKQPVQWSAPASGGGGGGGGSDVLVLHSTYDESLDADVLDKTALEIISASSDGKVVIIAPTIPGMLLTTSYLSYVSQTKLGGAAFKFMRIDPTGQIGVITYTAGTADDYPVLNV